MQSFREVNENRLLGASFFCIRERRRSGIEVFLINDSPKQEVSAGFTSWHQANDSVLSYPGGGRSILADGTPETLTDTLASELHEEVGLVFSLKTLESYTRLLPPFVVAQKKDQFIHQIGVVSALYLFDVLSREERQLMEKVTTTTLGSWKKLDELTQLYFKAKNTQETKDTELRMYRQHVFTMAYLWYLDLFANQPVTEIARKTDVLNRDTSIFISAEAKKRNLIIKNGVFDAQGSILTPDKLSTSDRIFLYGTRTQKSRN